MSQSVSERGFAEPLVSTRGVRFILIAVVLVMSYANVSLAMDMHRPGRYFGNLLHGKPLPAIMSFVLDAQPLLIVLSLFIPLAAFAAFFVRRLDFSVYLSSALILTVFLQMLGTWEILLLPLVTTGALPS